MQSFFFALVDEFSPIPIFAVDGPLQSGDDLPLCRSLDQESLSAAFTLKRVGGWVVSPRARDTGCSSMSRVDGPLEQRIAKPYSPPHSFSVPNSAIHAQEWVHKVLNRT